MTTPRVERGASVESESSKSDAPGGAAVDYAQDSTRRGLQRFGRYNTGSVVGVQAAIDDGAAWGRVLDVIWTHPGLSDRARLVLAYLCSRPPGWVPQVKNISEALGWSDRQWPQVRDELAVIGCLKASHARPAGATRTVHGLVIDLTPLFGRSAHPTQTAGRARDPTKRWGGNDINGGVARPHQTVGSEQRTEKKNTTTTAALQPVTAGLPAQPGVFLADKEVMEVTLAALAALPGVDSSTLDTQAARVVASVAAAAEDQRRIFLDVLLKICAGKTAARGAAYIHTLAKRAAEGALTTAPCDARGVGVVDWPAREARAGWFCDHPKIGRVEVVVGARAWSSTAGLISGAGGLKLWGEVDAGLIVLSPPAPPSGARARRAA